MLNLPYNYIIISGLILLSGCSSAEENAQVKTCEAAQQSWLTYDKKARSLNSQSQAIEAPDDWNFDLTDSEKILRDNKDKLYLQALDNYKLSLQVIITYKECFTPTQVIKAQKTLDNSRW